MVGEQLDFDLLRHLALHPRLTHLSLVYHLQRQHETRTQVTSHVHVPESPLTQLASHLELRQTHLFPLPRRQHAAEVEQRALCRLPSISPTAHLLSEQLLSNCAIFLTKIGFVFLFFGVLGPHLVGINHRGWVSGLSDCFLFEVLDWNCCFLVGGEALWIDFAVNSFFG